MSATRPSPDREKGRRGEALISDSSGSRSCGSNSGIKSPQPREVPERLRGGLRGRAPTKEHVASSVPTQAEIVKSQNDQHPSDSETQFPPTQDPVSKSKLSPTQQHQTLSPSDSVPSTGASPSVDRSSSGQISTITAHRELSHEQGAEPLSDSPQQGVREREQGVSVSSDSICSPEQQPEQDGPSLQPRSPRKRQTADGEVLKGLPEDSPSAKVLRKLPGRLVTVVEEKEPRRRRRGASGSGGLQTEGSSEEMEHAESVQDSTSHCDESQPLKDKPLSKSPSASPPSPMQQGQDQVSPSSLPSPGRGNQPYSPTHSPDMPVLRNLPVRRRLETESRMAAQLGELYPGRGRGLDRRTPLSPKKQEPNSSKESTTSPVVASDPDAASVIVVKRKRGRPPKMAPKPPEPMEQEMLAVKKSRSEEHSPSLSPKRKRGRPRKDSTVNTAHVGKSEQERQGCTMPQESCSSLNLNLPGSSFESLTLPPVPECSELSSAADGPFASSEFTPPTKADSQSTTSVFPAATLNDSLTKSTAMSELSTSNENTTSLPITPQSDLLTISTTIEAIPTANVSQTNTKPSLLHPAAPQTVTSDNSAAVPTQQFSPLSASSIPQSSQVTTSLFQQSAKSNKDISQQSMMSNHSTTTQTLTASTELLAQSSIESKVATTGTQEVSPTQTSPQCSHPSPPSNELLSEPVVAAGSPKLLCDLNERSQSQPTPEKTKMTPLHSSQTELSPVSTNQTTDSSQPSVALSQKPMHMPQSPAEQSETVNQEDSNILREDGVIESTEEIHIESFVNQEQVDRDDAQFLTKRRRGENLPEAQMPDAPQPASFVQETVMEASAESDGVDKPVEEESQMEDQESRVLGKKRNMSRQSSQESVRSSSPSSISSSGTCSSRSKKTEESRRPAKRTRVETDSESTDRGTDMEARRRVSNSSSTDSDDSSSPKRRLTRSAHKILEKETQNYKVDKRRKKQSEKNSPHTTVEGESRGATPVRVTRKSIGPQPASLLTTPASPEPEVLGKRCSALNAAAKLLAMRGRGPDAQSPSSKGKAVWQQPSSETSNKSKSKLAQDTPKTNSVNTKTGNDQQTPTLSSDSSQSTTATNLSTARSTRQRPGNLMPPLEKDSKRVKKEEKKLEEDTREMRSSRGHSACSSISSERGAGSSRSRSSSNSSQCTRSLSSRSTGPPHSHSRAPSSGSDTERGKSRHKKIGESRGREGRSERRSQKHEKPELSTGSSEGTPDRVLRSVAALAAAQARTPASNTRSSIQQRHSKT